MDPSHVPADSRYLKTPDGAVYGPVDSLTLCAWAADARITPGCLVSRDGRNWAAATDYAELRLHWQASLPDGTTVGPLNLFALWELIQDGSLPRGLPVRHCVTGEEVPLDERLLPVALKESRDLIKVMATQMAGSPAAAAAPEVDALKGRLAQAEKDLSDNLRLMGETQRLLVARDRRIKDLEERAVRAGMPAAAGSGPERGRELEALKTSLAGSTEQLLAATREVERVREESGVAVQAIRAEAVAAKAAHDLAAEGWATERAVLERRCRASESAVQDRAEAARAAEARAGEAERQLEAARQSAQSLEAGWAQRQAETVQAAAEAAGQARAAQDRLEQRLEAARAAQDAQAAECARLQAAVAADAAAKEQAAVRIAELEQGARDVLAASAAAQRRAAEAEQVGRDALARETAARASAEAGLAAALARCAEYEANLAGASGAAAEAEAALAGEREALLAKVSGLEQALAAAQGEVAAREERLAGQAATHEAALTAAGQAEAALRDRGARLEREIEQTIRRLNEAKAEATALRQSLADERGRSAETAKRLQAELKAVQRDLHALNLVKTVTRQIRDDRPNAPPRSTIDWLSAGPAPEPAAAAAAEPQDKFAGLDLHDQVGVLHEELKLSVDDKERLRVELDKLRSDHADLQRQSEDRERDLSAKVAQLQGEIQSGGAVLQQAMEELEKREGAWRLARKKAEEREKELAERITALEAELARKSDEPEVVIQGEWQAPPKVAVPPPEPAPPAPGAVLGTVEAQLQTELHKWDSLNRDKDRKTDKTRSWFRWKQP